MPPRGPDDDVYKRIFRVVHRIPPGRVATYGQVAALSGIPRGARLVGWALKACLPDNACPWWRVINAQGRISLMGPPGEDQRKRLEAEGIAFRDGRVDFKQVLWTPKGRPRVPE